MIQVQYDMFSNRRESWLRTDNNLLMPPQIKGSFNNRVTLRYIEELKQHELDKKNKEEL